MKNIVLITVLMGMAFVPSLTVAQEQRIDEAQVLKAAMLSSPVFQAVLLEAETEKADANQTARLDNPTLELNTVRTSMPGDRSTSYDVEIEQSFKFSQVTGARTQLSRTLFEQAVLRQQHGMIQATWAHKMLYAQVWQAQQQVQLYSDFQKRARDTAEKIMQAVQVGQTPAREASLFAGDAAKFGSDLEKIKAEEIRLRLQLEKATGLNLAHKTFEKPHLMAISNDIAALENEAQRNASLVKLLQTDYRVAERQAQVAQADAAAPEIAPRFIYGRNPAENKDSIGLGVVLSIPLWDANQSARRKAEAQKMYAQRQLDTLQTMPLTERLARIVDTIERLDRRIQTLEREALPNYRKGFSQAQKSFSAGQTDALALWQVRARLFETEHALLEAMLEAMEARRMLSLETGMMPLNIAVQKGTP